jgi:hypothetical protein
MLRSMIIGFAIAALLQVGTQFVTSADPAMTARHIDWVQMQTIGLARILCGSTTISAR